MKQNLINIHKLIRVCTVVSVHLHLLGLLSNTSNRLLLVWEKFVATYDVVDWMVLSSYQLSGPVSMVEKANPRK